MAQWIVILAGAYLAAGVVFAVAFALRGAAHIDPNAVDGSSGFRLVIMPGSALLWPVLVVRWVRRSGPPQEHNAHRDAARRAGDRP